MKYKVVLFSMKLEGRAIIQSETRAYDEDSHLNSFWLAGVKLLEGVSHIFLFMNNTIIQRFNFTFLFTL